MYIEHTETYRFRTRKSHYIRIREKLHALNALKVRSAHKPKNNKRILCEDSKPNNVHGLISAWKLSRVQFGGKFDTPTCMFITAYVMVWTRRFDESVLNKSWIHMWMGTDGDQFKK